MALTVPGADALLPSKARRTVASFASSLLLPISLSPRPSSSAHGKDTSFLDFDFEQDDYCHPLSRERMLAPARASEIAQTLDRGYNTFAAATQVLETHAALVSTKSASPSPPSTTPTPRLPQRTGIQFPSPLSPTHSQPQASPPDTYYVQIGNRNGHRRAGSDGAGTRTRRLSTVAERREPMPSLPTLSTRSSLASVAGLDSSRTLYALAGGSGIPHSVSMPAIASMESLFFQPAESTSETVMPSTSSDMFASKLLPGRRAPSMFLHRRPLSLASDRPTSVFLPNTATTSQPTLPLASTSSMPDLRRPTEPQADFTLSMPGAFNLAPESGEDSDKASLSDDVDTPLITPASFSRSMRAQQARIPDCPASPSSSSCYSSSSALPEVVDREAESTPKPDVGNPRTMDTPGPLGWSPVSFHPSQISHTLQTPTSPFELDFDALHLGLQTPSTDLHAMLTVHANGSAPILPLVLAGSAITLGSAAATPGSDRPGAGSRMSTHSFIGRPRRASIAGTLDIVLREDGGEMSGHGLGFKMGEVGLAHHLEHDAEAQEGMRQALKSPKTSVDGHEERERGSTPLDPETVRKVRRSVLLEPAKRTSMRPVEYLHTKEKEREEEAQRRKGFGFGIGASPRTPNRKLVRSRPPPLPANGKLSFGGKLGRGLKKLLSSSSTTTSPSVVPPPFARMDSNELLEVDIEIDADGLGAPYVYTGDWTEDAQSAPRGARTQSEEVRALARMSDASEFEVGTVQRVTAVGRRVITT